MPERLANVRMTKLQVIPSRTAMLVSVLLLSSAFNPVLAQTPSAVSGGFSPLKKAQTSPGFQVPAPPPAEVDLRRMHYGNASAKPPAFRVDLPPPAVFPDRLKIERADSGTPPKAAAQARPAGSPKTVSTIQAPAPVRVAAPPAGKVQIVLPPPVQVTVSAADVEQFGPAALALRATLEPLLQEPKPVRGKRGKYRARRLSTQDRVRQDIARFYASRNFLPVWYRAGKWTDAARSLVTRLQRADEDALVLGVPVPALPVAAAGNQDAGSEAAQDQVSHAKAANAAAQGKVIADTDLQLSAAAVRYARYARGARVNVRQVSSLIDGPADIPAAQDVLARLAQAEFAGDALWAYNPQQEGYKALRSKLAELRNRSDQKEQLPIAHGRTLRVGMRDARVPLIRLRFGIPAHAGEKHADLYDTQVASAIARFQRSRGLPANGRLSRATIRALSSDNRGRIVNEVIANMERWRWLPQNLGDTHILVNIPEYQLRMVRAGVEIHSTRVIVGKAKTPTPVFSDQMRFVVVNPYWNVPLSIIKKEMLPAFQRNPDYFKRNGYEVKDTGKRLVVRQPPGPRNALGYVKFLFPNRHAVYLHDTPGRSRFRYASRAFSHGCVRVQDPFKLAGLVLDGQKGWNERRLRRMIGGAERTIRMERKIPIHIVYFTASVDENGELRLFKDIYGHSARLRRLMSLKG
jgi:murein L,D-transpeptidase YcbB/YkuD